MTLILQGVRAVSAYQERPSQSALSIQYCPSFIQNINRLECTVDARLRHTSYHNKQAPDEIPAAYLHSTRGDKLTEPVTNKRTGWNKEHYSTASQYISSVTLSPAFSSGLMENTKKVNAFQESASKGYLSAFRYIANNANPNYYLGIFRNLLSFFSTGSINQNCVFCSKAVDKNLAELAQGRVRTFWAAKQTSRGTLPQNIAEESYQAFVMKPNQSLSSQLQARSREGSRNIIMVPVKNRHFSHAMNLVRTKSGDVVIDGQSGRIYDFSSAQGRARFDARYGHNRGLSLVQIYHTGDAPELATS